MSITVRPINPDFVAEVSGVDLRTALPQSTIEEIEAAILDFAVVVFRDQPLTEDEQVRFTERFGPLDSGLMKLAKTSATSSASPNAMARRVKNPHLAEISNINVDGEIAARTERRITSNFANQLWHSDSSFQRPAARYSMLSAVQVPAQGGDTQFADMRAAYDLLTDEMKAELEPLQATHYALHSRILLGNDDWTPAERAALPPVQWPIVRVNGQSGRKVLFIGAHAADVVGMTVAEGRMLLQDLLEEATAADRVYTHKWRAGDLVIWDNRATLHRGRRFDLREKRDMRRSTTIDATA